MKLKVILANFAKFHLFCIFSAIEEEVIKRVLEGAEESQMDGELIRTLLKL